MIASTAFVFAGTGCSGETGGQGGEAGNSDDDPSQDACAADGCWNGVECRRGSLESYWRDPFPTFEEAVAAADEWEEMELRVCTDEGVLLRSYSAIGTCGEYDWVVVGFGTGGQTEFFDSSGKLVGAEGRSDINEFCGQRSFTIVYGAVPDCTREVVDDTCEPVPFGLGRSPLRCRDTAATTLFFDGGFDADDWDTGLLIEGAAGAPSDFAATTELTAIGGDPDAYRAMSHTIDTQSCTEAPCGYTMAVVYRRLGWAYDPRETGTIQEINYSESKRARSQLRETLSTLVLFQENESGEEVRYEMVRGPVIVDRATWMPDGGCTLAPRDFTPTGLDFDGRPISFGYLRRTTVDDPGIVLVSTHDIDNFRVAVVPK